MNKRLRIVAGASIAVVMALFAYSYLTNHATPAGQPPLVQMTPQVLEQFKEDFNRARGQARLIVLLSPT
jgi:hypothetical protein